LPESKGGGGGDDDDDDDGDGVDEFESTFTGF
jgi:hypothetical protein